MCIAVLAGCTDASHVDPSELHTGIYTLQISTREDTCDPKRISGEFGTFFVGVSKDGISGWDPYVELSGSLYQRYDLPADAGYTLSTGAGIDPSTSCGGHSSFLTTRQLVTTTTDGMVVNETTDWTITAPCTNDVLVLGLPVASCHSDLDQSYRLVTACEPPCQVRGESGSPDSLTCVCP
jgi:hypothetical protein